MSRTPSKSCPHCSSPLIRKKGYYLVRILKTYRRRYQCLSCHKSFSTQTLHPTYRQKRPDLNLKILQLLCAGVPQRGVSRLLGCSKNTIDYKFQWLGSHCHPTLTEAPDTLFIDEMESIEHTKLKPLAIPICVSDQYEILATSVGQIPAKGPLAKLSVKKYGLRINQRSQALEGLFQELKRKFNGSSPKIIRTDGASHYKKLVKEHFPNSQHLCFSSRAHIQKKKEMLFLNREKKIFDPLFTLNQRCAKLRADIRRLTRRSWCTTKIPQNLALHLKLYQFRAKLKI